MQSLSRAHTLAAVSIGIAAASLGCGSSDTVLGPAGTGGASSASGATGSTGSPSSSSTSSSMSSSSGAGGATSVVRVTAPGEIALPGARFFQSGRFLSYTTATASPVTAGKVRVFDTTTQKTVELGPAAGFCSASGCDIFPRLFRVSKTGKMGMTLDTLPSPPTSPAWSVVDLSTGARKPISFGTWYEHLVAVLPDGGYVTVKQTFMAQPGALIYYPAAGGSMTLSATGNDPDSFSGVDVGEIEGKPVVVAAIYKGSAYSVDVYPLDGTSSIHLGTGQKVWVVGGRVLYFDPSAMATYSAPIAGGNPVVLGKSEVALDFGNDVFPIALASPDQMNVILTGVIASAVSPMGGATTPTILSSYDHPEFFDSQTLAFGKLDQQTNIAHVGWAKLTDTMTTNVADDAVFVHAGGSKIIYGGNTVFKAGSVQVNVPGIAPLSRTTGDLYDAHVFTMSGDQKVYPDAVTELAGSSTGIAMTRFDFDKKNNDAPAADDGLYYLSLP